eukprot:TRINITY_DN1792_c0_g1_i2.p1 TRINITY_DN1792_c0_g1~~TRINITY_DN1792_c0_g1_i2.p1  ORF type:complete len:602 (-),score=100.51 TRINITY_DN1792_c0_g1_i2:179-1984(-)
MKYFVITTDRNHLYHNHPGGMGSLATVCLPLAVSQENALGFFNEQYTSLSCDDSSMIVFERYGPDDLKVSFLVQSDKGETETFLRTQIDIIHRLLIMEYGPNVLYDSAKIEDGYFQMKEHEKRFENIINTVCYLSDTKQSFLVQASETLFQPNTNEQIQEICLSHLKAHLPSNACHALLFVGTKRLTHYTSKKSSFELDPDDLYSLVLYYQSQFNPAEPVLIPEYDSQSDVANQFVSAEEEWDSDEFAPVIFDIDDKEILRMHDLIQKGLVLGTSDDLVEILQILLDSMGKYSGNIDGILNEETLDSVKNLCHNSNSDKITFHDIMKITSMCSVESEPIESISSSPVENSVLRYSPLKCIFILNRVLQQYAGQPEPIYKQLYFMVDGKYFPFYVWTSQIYTPNTAAQTSPMTLMMIMKNGNGSEQEREELIQAEEKIRNELIDDFMDFLVSVENTHSMISYVRDLPGLVHFIVVDRIKNYVHAPAITCLSGPLSKHKYQKRIRETTLAILKNRVWDLCYQSQEFLARGYFTMLMKCGDFQYFYDLCFETKDGELITINEPICDGGKVPLTTQFYKQLKQKLEASKGVKIVKCYEIYGIIPN